MYRESREHVRSSFRGKADLALEQYRPFLNFVTAVHPQSTARLLDVGCGSGWSTLAFALAGYHAVGIDLNPSMFEPPPHDQCMLVGGSATDIPCADDSFDLVVSYQCLEHVPDPRRVLDEMARVCRPGGIVAIVGPNLVNPISGLVSLARSCTRGLPRFRRREGMSKHPYGNTVPEILRTSVVRSAQLLAKLGRRSPHFSMRVPDLVPPLFADNDACYLCNPTDLIAYFKQIGFSIVRRTRPGRPPLVYLLAGGTWVAARKPEKSS